jgi:hypothetical protein
VSASSGYFWNRDKLDMKPISWSVVTFMKVCAQNRWHLNIHSVAATDVKVTAKFSFLPRHMM